MGKKYIESVPIWEYNICGSFCLKLWDKTMGYLTTSELSKVWNISRRRIATLCKEGRIDGAMLKGKTWLIPDNIAKPIDPRKEKNINRLDMTMIKEIISNTNTYVDSHSKDTRKDKGQFFTAPKVAYYMGKSAIIKAGSLSILEPGAGNGLLMANAVYYCATKGICHDFKLSFVENDPDILPVLKQNIMIIERWLRENKCTVETKLYERNFILHDFEETFDMVICNPPYNKISGLSKNSYGFSISNKLHSIFYIHG